MTITPCTDCTGNILRYYQSSAHPELRDAALREMRCRPELRPYLRYPSSLRTVSVEPLPPRAAGASPPAASSAVLRSSQRAESPASAAMTDRAKSFQEEQSKTFKELQWGYRSKGHLLLGAVQENNEKLVIEILEKAPELVKLLARGDEYGRTPLILAVLKGNGPMAKLFLEKGANPNLATVRDWRDIPASSTALSIAAQKADKEMCDLLKKWNGGIDLQKTSHKVKDFVQGLS